MDVVRRADGPVMVKQVCRELGTSSEPARSEAMRAKLNRLAERDLLRKLRDGKFTTALRGGPARRWSAGSGRNSGAPGVDVV